MKRVGNGRITRRHWSLLLAMAFLAWPSCLYRTAGIDAKTGQFPASATVPEGQIHKYEPVDISRIGVVFIDTSIVGVGFSGYPKRQDRQHEFFRTHVAKIGAWRVTDNSAEVAAACGFPSTPLIDYLGSQGCELLKVEIHELTSDGRWAYRVSIVKYPEGRQVLAIEGERTAWLDWETEIDLPLLNVVKRWHDDSLSSKTR